MKVDELMPLRLKKIYAIVTLVLGIAFVIVGGVAWSMTSSELKSQEVTVPDDATMFAGKQVAGPLTAYAQQATIKMHVEHALGGETYSSLSTKVMQAQSSGDTEAATQYESQRDMASLASSLRSALFTSILAFGLAALALVVGIWMILGGIFLLIRKKA